MINCKSCGKENQSHYKFCLGCGSELAPIAEGKEAMGTMKTMAVDKDEAAKMAQPVPKGRPPGVSQPQEPLICSACDKVIPPNFKFCGACGAPAGGPRAESAQPGEEKPSDGGLMTLIRPDGSEGGTQELQPGDNTIGRDHGKIFESDGYLSPSHAMITIEDGSCLVRDLGSLNGVFLKMVEENEVFPGQIFRIGQELLRFDEIVAAQTLDDGTDVMGSPNPGYWGRVTVIIGEHCDGASYPLSKQDVFMGRERGDINFPDDGYVSGLHAQISNRGEQFFLSDMGSSNGTFLKCNDETELPEGSFVLLGQQLFRINF